MGVDPAVLDEVRLKHAEAHIHWEWWSASNGAHFHNPQQFEESINKGMVASQAGIKLLDDAMAKQRAARGPAPAAAPGSAPAPARTSGAPATAVPVAQLGR
jgi:hypothetical protein